MKERGEIETIADGDIQLLRRGRIEEFMKMPIEKIAISTAESLGEEFSDLETYAIAKKLEESAKAIQARTKEGAIMEAERKGSVLHVDYETRSLPAKWEYPDNAEYHALVVELELLRGKVSDMQKIMQLNGSATKIESGQTIALKVK